MSSNYTQSAVEGAIAEMEHEVALSGAGHTTAVGLIIGVIAIIVNL